MQSGGRFCDPHNCSEKVREIYLAQFVEREWNPHPPQTFLKWYAFQSGRGKLSSEAEEFFGHKGEVIEYSNPVTAFNTAHVYEEWQKVRRWSA